MKFDSYHPAINLIFFSAVILCAILFDHPVFMGIGYVCSFAYSIKLNGRRALFFNLALIFLGCLFVCYYAAFNHFGVTVLGQNSIGNNYTLESLAYGASIALRAVTVIMWLSCVHAIFTADKVVYLLGRLSPRLSLLLAILLRTVPRVKSQAALINAARAGIGKDVGTGSFLRRLRNGVQIGSSTLTWIIDNFAIVSESMKSRGSLLRGRTAFSIYRFDHRDRSVVIFMFICLAVVCAAIPLDQTKILYSPEIIMNRMTVFSYAFYGAYALFCLMPLALQVFGEARFKGATGAIDDGVFEKVGTVSPVPSCHMASAYASEKTR